MTTTIEPLSYSDVMSGDHARRDRATQVMLGNFDEHRCIIVRDLPFVRSGLLDRAMILNKRLHAVQEDVLRQYARLMPDGSPMYNAVGPHLRGCEQSKDGLTVGTRNFWMMALPHPEGHPAFPHYFDDNPIWPQEPGLETYRATHEKLMPLLVESFSTLFSLFIEGVGYDYDEYRPSIAKPMLDLRGNCYRRMPSKPSLIEHVDNAVFTYVMGADVDGTRVKTKSGEWITIQADWDEVLVMLGDATALTISDEFVATPHEVWVEDVNAEYRHNLTAFFAGNAMAEWPIKGDKTHNSVLKTHPEIEGMSCLDGCDVRWRKYATENMTIKFLDHPHERKTDWTTDV